MKIEFITNASFLVTLNNGKTLLTDPWFDGPCYYGSWYNFPPVEQKERYFNCKPDYIYISHIHPDHFHPQTLKHFPLDTQIIIARFPHNHLKSQIAACGFKNIQEFDVKKYHPFEKGRIVFFPEFSTSSFDVDDGIHYALDREGTLSRLRVECEAGAKRRGVHVERPRAPSAAVRGGEDDVILDDHVRSRAGLGAGAPDPALGVFARVDARIAAIVEVVGKAEHVVGLRQRTSLVGRQ